MHHGRCTQLSCVDEHHEELGDRNVALGLHGAAGAIPGALNQRGAGGIFHQESHGDPRRHRHQLPNRHGNQRVHPLLHAETITGSCRDYRATATCDFEMDTADKDKKIGMPLLLLWGARGQPLERAKEFLDVWRRYASNIVAHEAIECGHYIQEEVPDKVIQHFTNFFKA